MKKILLIALLSIMILSGCSKETKKEENKITKNNGMLSYTIDGEKTDIKPTKEEGYIVNRIICDNGSDMMWDNDNWEVEITKINSKDRCKVDFTKDTSKEGYRVTVTSNSASSLDSLSKATTKNGTVNIYSESTIKTVTGCNGVIENNKVIINNIISNQTCNIEVELKTLVDTIKLAYNANDNRRRTDFSKIDNGTHVDTPDGLTGGLYTTEDDDGLTYYFSGDGTNMNNWVSFASKMWRIIRINGNGSVRLLYAGNGIDARDLGTSAYNEAREHPAYVGWKYTKGDDLSINRQNGIKSTIYNKVETWYKSLGSANQNYIDTSAIYCNDRNLASGNSYDTSNGFDYAAIERLKVNKAPIFTCSNDADKYTSFGLMTADEIVAAGGLWITNNNKAYYYLNSKASDGSTTCTGSNGDPCSITGKSRWWTMTPALGKYGDAIVFCINGYESTASLEYASVYWMYSVRPVISLKSKVLVTEGDGSASAPYQVILP